MKRSTSSHNVNWGSRNSKAGVNSSRPARSQSSGDRLLSVLELFSDEQPAWTVEDAAQRLETSVATAYRYFRSLAKVGLISQSDGANYTLGPAIIELDRQIRLSDSLLRAGRPVMEDLIRYTPEGSVIILCRVFRDRIICVHHVMTSGPQTHMSYERGRPMPLFRGAAGKIVLANLPSRTLKVLFEKRTKEIKGGGLGQNWEAFKKSLSVIRRAGSIVTWGEIDRERVGTAAPIFAAHGPVLGSLGFGLPAYCTDETLIARLLPLNIAGAHEIEQGMRAGHGPQMEVARRRTMREVPRSVG